MNLFSHEVCCKGCPAASEEGKIGCAESTSFRMAQTHDRGWIRAKFWKENLERIEVMPAQAFTRKGWEFFDLQEPEEAK
jgi:hypothetical protein